ncbi:MAG: PASTA domain-containing protein [Pseudonocardiaceae bacterium]|nr:PASTA domain-containing protein [Pseudonocardiaceae bacterium]
MRRRRPVTEVPDVVGLNAGDACDIVRAAGLVPYGPEYAAEPTSGTVTEQRPVGTAGAEEGTAVFLWTRGHPDTADDLVPRPLEEASPV